jgi:hypothetical protein
MRQDISEEWKMTQDAALDTVRPALLKLNDVIAKGEDPDAFDWETYTSNTPEEGNK